MADSGHKSISRIDVPAKKMHGWYVRVWFKGKMHSKFFNDKFFDSSEDALEVAIEYRNEIEKNIGKPRTERVVVTNSPRSETGVVGVTRTRKQTGAYVPYTDIPLYSDVYEVTWQSEPNVVHRTSVSIAKYGEEEAFRRAVEIRRAREREIYGQAVTPLPAELEDNG